MNTIMTFYDLARRVDPDKMQIKDIPDTDQNVWAIKPIWQQRPMFVYLTRKRDIVELGITTSEHRLTMYHRNGSGWKPASRTEYDKWVDKIKKETDNDQ